MSQRQLADDLGLRGGGGTVSMWERGRTEISQKHAEALAAYFKVPLKEVTGADPPPGALTPATDVTVRESFQIAGRLIDSLRDELAKHGEAITELREAVVPRLDAFQTALGRLIAVVEEQEKRLQDLALPATKGRSKSKPPPKPGRRDQAS